MRVGRARLGAILLLAAWLAMAVWPRPALAGGEERLGGGIGVGSEYKELFVFAGRPVVLTGQAKVSASSGSNGKAQVRVSHNLKNEASQVTLTRSLSLAGEEKEALDGRQLVTSLTATAFTESIRAGNLRYTLRRGQLSYTRLTDRAGGVNYFTSNWSGTKVYDFNGNRGTLTVQMWGRGIGYEHAWGTTETQHLDLVLDFEGQVEERTAGRQVTAYPVQWSGSVSLDLTYTRWRRLDYLENEAVPISFAGGYLESRGEQATLKYEVDLPVLDSLGRVVAGGRVRNQGTLGLESSPTYARLPVPVLRDLEGHWSWREVLRLASLGVFAAGEYFGPELPITRGDFSLALARLLELEPSPQPAVPGLAGLALASGRSSQSSPSSPAYLDVPEDSPYYGAVEALRQRQVLADNSLYFRPQEGMTRAEAVALVVRALGLESLAAAVVQTPFQDDQAIPAGWKRAVWVAERLGLVGGTSGGYFQPQRRLTRGEAAALFNRTLSYLQEGLRRDYQNLVWFR
ncbi:MAG: S-layer homology domain-containing protein [Moorellales bacterium]